MDANSKDAIFAKLVTLHHKYDSQMYDAESANLLIWSFPWVCILHWMLIVDSFYGASSIWKVIPRCGGPWTNIQKFLCVLIRWSVDSGSSGEKVISRLRQNECSRKCWWRLCNGGANVMRIWQTFRSLCMTAMGWTWKASKKVEKHACLSDSPKDILASKGG